MMRRRRVPRVRAMVGNQRPIPFSRPRRRRISKRQFRRLLWNQTITATKFKSTFVSTGTSTTPANTTGSTVTKYWAAGIANDSKIPFWLSGAGLIQLSGSIASVTDPTETPPTFNSDLIIRGGTLSFTITNDTETADVGNDIIIAKIVLLKTGSNWTANGASYDNSLNTSVPSYGIVPDFKTNVGYICLEKDFMIKDGESATVTYKLPVQKINIGDYMNERFAYVWYLSISNAYIGSAQTCHYYKSHNISFCGDVAS